MKKLIHYFRNIGRAILGQYSTTTEHVVTQPLNKGQLKYLEALFKNPVYTEGMSLTEIAYKTGQYNVIEFIKTWSERGGKI